MREWISDSEVSDMLDLPVSSYNPVISKTAYNFVDISVHYLINDFLVICLWVDLFKKYSLFTISIW